MTKKGFFAKRVSLLTFMMVLVIAPVNAARLYKWVDDEGNVHIGDTVPADQIDFGRKELNKSGRTIQDVRGRKTEQQKKIEAYAKELKRRRELSEARREKRDRTLMLTYSSEDDLILARTMQLKTLESTIELLQRRFTGYITELVTIETRADLLKQDKKEVPKNITDNMTRLSRLVFDSKTNLEQKKMARDLITNKLNLDLMRYRELKAGRTH